jgi:clan AA aspartic protease (TIGR02281 family)
MGARMALAFDDWRTAENIMGSQWFPLDMSDQVKQIQDRIRLLKTGSDKIAVRFAPDAGRIGVQAVLNQRLRQGFIVDTGASMVTIPVAAAKQLGLYDASAPKHRVVTAGGVVFAPSVMIGSIGIGGWTETRIEAFVMDLPEYPGIGLLGMNYLNRFKMEVNADDGILTLAPR